MISNIFCLNPYSELKAGEARQISIRDGSEFQEIFEVRRLWRDNRYDPNFKEKYFDIAILELGKNNYHDSFNPFFLKIFIFSERRIIFDYEIYGDSPTCLGEEKDLEGYVDWLKCIHAKSFETEYDEDIGDFLDLTHKQIEEACEGKLPHPQSL